MYHHLAVQKESCDWAVGASICSQRPKRVSLSIGRNARMNNLAARKKESREKSKPRQIMNEHGGRVGKKAEKPNPCAERET